MAAILLCVAGSRSARSAARVARFLSLHLDSELILAHPRAREDGRVSSERVVTAAVESEAELIVAPSSSHLRGGAWSEDLHHALERSAPCPVVVAPARLRQPWPLGGGLLCAVDGSDEALVAACVAGDLANRLGAPLTIADAAGGQPARHAARAQALVNALL